MEGNNMNSEYNKEHIFDSQLKELLDKIDIICRQEQIPYFFTCAIKNDEQDTKYHSEMLSTLKSDRILKNDIIAECLKLLRGYHTTLGANVSTSLKVSKAGLFAVGLVKFITTETCGRLFSPVFRSIHCSL